MVLKQTMQLESRWLYDALHESGHIKNGDVTDDNSLIEDQEISPETSGTEEEAANEWAEDTLFDGRSEELEEACTKACHGQLQRLKAALPEVAKEFNVNLGSLANHMAYRLKEQHENWWGAAQNLQRENCNPFDIAREILLQRMNLSSLSIFMYAGVPITWPAPSPAPRPPGRPRPRSGPRRRRPAGGPAPSPARSPPEIAQHHVLGLEVAVDHAAAVGVRHRVADAHEGPSNSVSPSGPASPRSRRAWYDEDFSASVRPGRTAWCRTAGRRGPCRPRKSGRCRGAPAGWSPSLP